MSGSAPCVGGQCVHDRTRAWLSPGTVLIVEDEPLVGLFLVDVLEDLDQMVIGADACNEVALHRTLCRDLAFLPKPYTAEQFGSTIRALLQCQA